MLILWKYEKRPLVLVRKTGKLHRGDLRQSFRQLKMCPMHFAGKTLWITCSQPCEHVPWQRWQEWIFMLPAKALPLGAGLSVSAPDPFPVPNPRNFCLYNGHCISSFLLMGSGPDLLSTSSISDMHMGGFLWEGPAWHCQFLIWLLIWLLICLFILPRASLLWWPTANWSCADKMASV